MSDSSTNVDSGEPAARPIRVGVFDNVHEAESAVTALLDQDFSPHEVTVFCNSKWQESHFTDLELPPGEAGKRGGDVRSAAAGSAIGGVLGGLTAVAGLATLAGIPILVAGGLAAALTGGVVGGFTGAMMGRGVEKEPADFFDQAVADGKLLVAVEPLDSSDIERIALAARVLEDAGAQPLPLREG